MAKGNKESSSQDERSEKMRPCPACGKEFGRKKRKCPHCAAPMAFRVKESTIIKVSCVVFVSLTIILALLAVFSDTEVSKVEDLKEEDSFEIMRFKGKIVESPRYYPEDYSDIGRMKLLLNDTTGEITINVAANIVEELMDQGKIPSLGDEIDVMGSVGVFKTGGVTDMDIKISDNGLLLESGYEYDSYSYSLTLTNPDNLEIMSNDYDSLSISDIAGTGGDAYENGKKVKIEGTVISSVTNWSSAYQITLKDMTTDDTILLYVPKDVVELSGVDLYSEDDIAYNLKPGSEISILGSLMFYENVKYPQYSKWELIPTSAGDNLKIAGRNAIKINKEGQGFSVDMLMGNKDLYEGADVSLENVVIDRMEEGDLYVKDPGGTYSIMVFSYDPITDIDVGDRVNLFGEFTYYAPQDIWEIKLSDAENIWEVS